MTSQVVDPQSIELELRFLRPKGFKAPASLAGMQWAGKSSRLHKDHYFDAAAKDGSPALRAKRCTLRVRELEEGKALVTFKERGPSSKVATSRLETEEYLYGPAADPALLVQSVNQIDNAGLSAARAIAGAGLVELFSISCLRTEHTYRSEEGEVTLCEDEVTYPDGSRERRVEVELVSGEEKLLERAHKKLARRYPGLKLAARGKQSEGRRRLSKLL